VTPASSCAGCRHRQETEYPGLTLAVCELTGRIVAIECDLGVVEDPGCVRRTAARRVFEGAIA